MRTLNFTKHLKLRVSGKVSQHCIALGDIDGDTFNELVVGISDFKEGTILIYKGKSNQSYWELNGVGNISCVAIGDVCNQKKNSILIITSSGQCSIIDILPGSNGPSHLMKTTQLIPNIRNVLIGDVNNSSVNELVACHCNKAVSAYRWNERLKKFILLKRWKLNHLPSNITLHLSTENQRIPVLMASQPGCSYAILKFGEEPPPDADCSDETINDTSPVQYKELSSVSRLQDPNISSTILGGIMKSSNNPYGYFALCTLDGTLKLMEGSNNLWSVQVDHQLFAMNKLDVLGDNREEVIVCAWDGWTYIVDHDRNVVRYRFPDDVQAFCAGSYCIEEQKNVPCLIYVDFHKHIFLYYDVQLPFLRVSDFVSFAEADSEMASHFSKLGLERYEEKVDFLKKCLEDEKQASSNLVLDDS